MYKYARPPAVAAGAAPGSGAADGGGEAAADAPGASVEPQITDAGLELLHAKSNQVNDTLDMKKVTKLFADFVDGPI
eukprot:2764338-Alexandrium_andersonii.AAC.1